MRVAELSRVSGVPVPSIKYYLRTGLLPAGERTAPNQATYTQRHLHRLRLIRALIDVGGLSVSGVKEVVDSLDSQNSDLNLALGTAIAATLPEPKADSSSVDDDAREAVEALIAHRGWRVTPDSPKIDMLVKALSALHRLIPDYAAELTDLYADMAERMAESEIEWVARRGDTESAAEAAIVGTFIGASVFNAMRLIAHEDASRRTLGGED